eukprot:6176679-Pleurochrysis_carterae.AAC.4
MCARASTSTRAGANLLKTMIGSGILTLPWATAQVGVFLSLSGLLILAYLTQEAIRFAVRCVALIERESIDEEKHSTPRTR